AETLTIDHSTGHGASTDCAFGASDESETGIPSFTSAAACRRFCGVIRFSVPSSSSGPHRPQFDSSVCQRSYSALVTCGCAGCDCPTTEVMAPARRTAGTRATRVLIVLPSCDG